MNTNEIKKLYTALRGKGYSTYDLGDENAFETKMSDKNNRKELYDWVSSRGDFRMGDYEKYEARLTSPMQPEGTTEDPIKGVSMAPMEQTEAVEQPQQQTLNVAPIEQNPEYVEGFGQGVKQGWKGMKEGVRYLAGETANLVTGTSRDDKAALDELNERVKQGEQVSEERAPWLNRMFDKWVASNPSLPPALRDAAESLKEQDKINKLINQALEDAGGDIDQARKILAKQWILDETWGDRVMEDASKEMGELKPTRGFGAWVGNLVPQMIPAAAAIIASVVTKNPKFASLIGKVGIGAMTAATAGQSMKEARDAGASTSDVWTAGIVDGVIEYATEQIPFNTYTKNLLGITKSNVGKELAEALADNNSPARKELETLLSKANKNLGGKLLNGKNAKDLAASMIAEGSSEFMAEAMQTITPMLYENPEDYPTIMEVVNNGFEGFKAGIFMGSVLGGASKAAEHNMQRSRRKAQGFVDVAQVKGDDGVSDIAEIVGRNEENGNLIILQDGETSEVKPDQIEQNYRFSFDEFERGVLQSQADESFENGYTLTTPEEKQDANSNLAYWADRLRVDFQMDDDADPEELFEGYDNPLDALNSGQFAREDDYKDALQYIYAKATMDGAVQNVRDQIDARIAENNARIDGVTNQTDNTLMPATLKQDDRQVFIVRGKVSQFDDGSIDGKKSDDHIFIVDAQTLKPEMIAPSAILSLGAIENADTAKETQAAQIAEQMATEASAQMDGTLGFVQGDTYNILGEDGIQHTAQVVADNGDGSVQIAIDGAQETTTLPKDQVQAMSDAYHKARAIAYNEQKKAEEVAEQETQVAEEAPQSALEQIPTNENGEQVFEQAPAETTWAALIEMNEGDVAEAADTAQQMLEVSQKELEKATNEKAGVGTSVAEIQKIKAERKAKIDALQNRVNYWTNVLSQNTPTQEVAQAEEVAEPIEAIAEEPIVVEDETPIVEEETAPIIEEAQVAEPIVEAEEVVEPIVEQSRPKVKNISKKEDARRQPLRERVAQWVDKLGVPVVVMETFSDIENADAKREIRKGGRIAGWYEPSTGAVMLYMPHLTDMTEIDKTITHEIVAHKGLAHMLGKNKHNALLDRVWDMMSDEAKAKYINYPNVNGNTRRAADEYIAFLSEGVNLTELDQSVWDKIVGFVRELLAEVGINMQLTDADIADLIRLSYTNLVRENQKAKETKGADDINEQEGQALFSIRTYEESGRENLQKFLKGQVKKKRITKADAEAIEATMEQMYETAVEYKDKFAPFGAWSEAEVVKGKDGQPVFSVVKKNGEYTMNLDFSTVCKKRRTLDAVFSEMIDRGLIDMIPMEGEQIAEINNIIREYGFETACALCFVDAKRFRVAQVADKFCDMWNPMTKMSEEELQGVINEYGKKVVRGKIARHLIEHPEDRVELGRENFIESNGFEQMEINHPEILSLYKQAQGTSLAKIPFGDVQYLNEIEGNSWTPEAAYAVGGVRLQSFSDYVPRMFFDYMQMTAGLASKKLPVHANTKEPLFAKQFGLTGMKINLSLVPKVVEGGVAAGLDADGNYAWMEGETFPFEEAMVLQNAEGYRENCGTIAVGVSDEHIEKMLDDPNIRMIIPYHKSGLNPLVAKKNRIAEFTDYTNVQNTRSANGTKLEKEDLKDMPDFNSLMHDEGMDARQAAQAYLDWCDSKGFIPKFNKFRGHQNYYKLLEDFTTIVPNAEGVETTYPQREVTMTFPTEESAFGSIESLIREGLEEDAILEGKREEKLGEIVDTIEKEMVRFRFIGQQGAANLDKAEEATTRLDDLNVARQMETEGKDAKTIKMATGWERGADDKWRYEQNDSITAKTIRGLKGVGAKKIQEARSKRIKDLDKYAYITQIVGIDKLYNEQKINETSWPEAQKQIWRDIYNIYKDSPEQAEEDYVNARHTIQNLTKLGKGEYMLYEVLGENDELLKAYPQLRNMKFRLLPYKGSRTLGRYNRLTNTIEVVDFRGLFGNDKGEGAANTAAHELQHAIQEIEGFARGGNPSMSVNSEAIGNEGYQKLAGEVEARNVERRRLMTDEERLASLASETEDVARKDQIFIFNALADENQKAQFRVVEPAPTFYSNAANAVLGIKQEKATPEQWLKMIEKNGGLKAGEDKWLGLSDWLKASDKKTLTKQEVLDYIKENQIQIEDVEYRDRELMKLEIEGSQQFINLQDEYMGIFEDYMENPEADMSEYEAEQYARDAMVEQFGNYFNVAFATFGKELYVDDAEFAAKLLGLPYAKELNQTRLDYTTQGLTDKREIALTVPTIESWGEADETHFGDAGDGRAIAWIRFGETTDPDGKRVLVIDEIQSKRHQEGREKGYRPSDVDKYLKDNNVEVVETGEFYEFYRDGELDRRFSKGLLHYNIKEAKNLYVAGYNKSDIPEAPFEKNWAELAMKRMLRYAAENDFDKVAWTKGDQQAERYDLSKSVERIDAEDNNVEEASDGTPIAKNITIRTSNWPIHLYVDANGVIRGGQYANHQLSEVVGKGIAEKLMQKGDVSLSGDGLRIGGEGMKGFYDEMLPRFMNKYGKKWGVKVQDVTLPFIEEAGRTMHSVDVTDSMRESVMQGQPMFRVVDSKKPFEELEERYKRLDKSNTEALNAWRDEKAATIQSVITAISDELGFEPPIMVFNGGKDIQEVVDHIVDAYKEMANLDVDKEWVKTYIEESKAIGLYWPDAGVITSDVSNYDNTNDVLQASSMLMHENTHHLVNSQFDNQDLEAIWDEAVNASHPLVNHIEKKYKNIANGEKGNEVLAYAIGNIAKNTRENLFNYVKGEPISEENLLEKAEYSLPLGKFALSGILNTYKNDLRRSKEEVGGSNREANRGDHRVGRLLRDRSGIRRKAVKEAAELFAKQLNTPIRIVEDVNTITDDNAKLQERKRNAKGWFDRKANEVVVVLPNATSVEDVRETIFHEVVGHKGLRDLVGKERYDAFLEKVYRGASETIRERIARRAAKLGWDFNLATDEYLADLAEEGFEDRENRNFFEVVRDLFLDMLSEAKIALGYNISDNDMRYMLWRTYQMQRSKGAMGIAEDMVMQQKLGVGNFAPNDTQFRVAENGSLAKRVSDIMEEYDDSEEIFTIEDVADRIEELINEYDGNDSTTTLENILNDYRDAQSEANRYGHRWDAGGEDAFEEALRLYASQPTQFRVAEGEYLKAPNGKDTNLTPEQWEMVRTKEFKNWFGDWEKPYRIEKLRRTKSVSISGNEIEAGDDMKVYRKNAFKYGKSLRGEYLNADTNNTIIINRDSITEVLHHDGNNVAHIQSIAAIPQMIENGIYITSEPVSQVSSEKLKNAKEVQYYVCGLNIGGVPYTVKFVVAEFENGERYYDHALTQIEKGDLLNRAELSSTVADSKSPISDIKDKRLVLILQTNSSKILDANGEPLVVWHGGEFATDEFVANGAMHFGTKTAALQRILDNAWGYGNWEVTKNEDGTWGWSYTDPDDSGYDKRSEGSFARPLDAMEDAVTTAAPNAVVRPYFLNIRVLERTMDQNTDWEDVISESKEDGHDGIVYRNDFEDDGEDSYIAFSPEQIKLADGSNTTFDPTDDDVRFRAISPSKISTKGIKQGIRNEYDKLVKTSAYQSREASQDLMLSLRRFMEMTAKAYEIPMDAIKDWENAYQSENALSSKNEAQIEEFDRLYGAPLIQTVQELRKKGYTYEQIDDYLQIKHGIERNREMAVRAAISDEEGKMDKEKLEKWNAAKERVSNDQSLDSWEKEQRELDRIAKEEFEAEFNRDYSGLTAMFPDEKKVADAVEKGYAEVNDFEKNVGQNLINELWRRIRAANMQTLNKTYRTGLISKETFDSISNMYSYYVPLRGFAETTSDEVYGYLNNEPMAFNAPIRKARGRSSKADQVLPNVLSAAHSAILQGNRNMMKNNFLNFVQHYPTDLVSVQNMWVEYDKKSKQWVATFPDLEDTDTPEEVAAKTQEFEEKMKELKEKYPKQYKQVTQKIDVPYIVQKQHLKQHQIVVKRNGVDVVLTVNGSPRLAIVMNGTQPTKTLLGEVKDWASARTRYLSGMYTSYHPDFVVSNYMRDAIYTNSTVWLKESPAYAARFNKNNVTTCNPVNMGRLILKYSAGTLDMNNEVEKAFHDFVMNGGETGYAKLASIEQLKKDIGHMIDPTMFDNVKALGKKLAFINRSAESSARFAAFLTSRQMGRSVARSVADAKEISVNFNKKGAGDLFMDAKDQTWVGKIVAGAMGWTMPMYAFFNAGMQGLNNFLRIYKHAPLKTTALTSGLFLLGALIASMLEGDDEEEYYALPESVRRQNIVFRAGDNAWVKIPLPIEMRAIYGLGEMFTSITKGKEDLSKHGIAYKMAEQLSQVLPINVLEGKGGLGTLVPTLAAPIAETMSNEDWAGLPIYRDDIYKGDSDIPEYLRVYQRTGKGYVAVSKALNDITGGDNRERGALGFVNPAVIEHLVDGYLGGPAQFMNKVVSSAEMAFGDKGFDLRSVPFVNRVLMSDNTTMSKKTINNYYYRHKEEAERIDRLVKNYQKDMNDPTKTDEERAYAAEKAQEKRDSEEWLKAQEFLRRTSAVEDIEKQFKEAPEGTSDEVVYKVKDFANEVYKKAEK